MQYIKCIYASATGSVPDIYELPQAGDLPIHIQGLACNGSEGTVLDCAREQGVELTCPSKANASVFCPGKTFKNNGKIMQSCIHIA